MRWFRRRSRRTFTLQMYARPPEPVQLSQEPSGGVSPHVRDALKGHSLECPECGMEPECAHSKVNTNARVAHSWTGAAVVLRGALETRLFARCVPCKADIEYILEPDGKPLMVDVVIHQ